MEKNKKQVKQYTQEQYVELENKLKKALADYINLERDMEKRLELRSVQLKIEIGLKLMEILDASNLALSAKDNLKLEGDVKAWVDGLVVILSQIEKTLNTLGIEKIDVKQGDDFDSSKHEALATVNEGEKGKIYKVVSNGYMLGDFVVRPSRVVVCNGKA